MTSTPDPSTASVIPCAARAPRCAALSIPTASPLVMASPRAARYSREFMRSVPALRRRIAAADDGQLRIVQGVEVAGDVQRDRVARRRTQQGRDSADP